MKNYLEHCLFLILAGIVRLLGLKISRRLSIIIALIFYYIIPIRKQVTLKNLHKAFPEYSENKIKKIAFGSYKSFSIALVEIVFIPFMTREQIENAIYCENVELVKKYYKRNNGLIVLSGHFGNWEYIALSVSAKINVPFHVVVKSQSSGLFDLAHYETGQSIVALRLEGQTRQYNRRAPGKPPYPPASRSW